MAKLEVDVKDEASRARAGDVRVRSVEREKQENHQKKEKSEREKVLEVKHPHEKCM